MLEVLGGIEKKDDGLYLNGIMLLKINEDGSSEVYNKSYKNIEEGEKWAIRSCSHNLLEKFNEDDFRVIGQLLYRRDLSVHTLANDRRINFHKGRVVSSKSIGVFSILKHPNGYSFHQKDRVLTFTDIESFLAGEIRSLES